MRRPYRCLILLVAVLQVIYCQTPGKQNYKQIRPPREPKDFGIYHPYQQKIPRHCWHPPRDIDLHKCCPVPNLYSDEVMDICEIESYSENNAAVPDKRKTRKAPCQDGKCLMKNSNLLMENGEIDYEKFGTYIDNWAANNSEFTEAILAAKPTCAKKRGKYWYRGQPPNICDQDRVFLCLHSLIIWNCPLKEFEECHRLKEHMNECRPHYMNPEETDENTKTQ